MRLTTRLPDPLLAHRLLRVLAENGELSVGQLGYLIAGDAQTIALRQQIVDVLQVLTTAGRVIPARRGDKLCYSLTATTTDHSSPADHTTTATTDRTASPAYMP